MALTKAQKTDKVGKLAGELAGSTSAIIGTFKALTADKDFDLRKTVRAAGGSYHVVKNKLAEKASVGTKIESALKGLKGVSSVAYTSGDPVALAKALSDWVKDNSEFTFKLGIVDGKVITVEEIKELANMPGKEELFSKLLFLIQSPAQRLATVLNATGRDLAVVLGQGVEKEKFSGAAAPVAAVAEAAPAPAAEASVTVAEATSAPEPVAEIAPVAEAPAPAPTAEAAPEPVAEIAPEPVAAPVEEAALVAETHAAEAPTPTEQIAENPASEVDAVAEPENGTASQRGKAATTEPAEG
jgi:large subunit ribosomal protein L10